jgi:environmental stress-induced protein Ves
MNWKLISLAQAAAQPWRNGGGVTRELLAFPSAADWKVRISVADVQAPGPFSRFPGIERWFAVLEGGGVVLDIEDKNHRVTPADAPLRFDGAAATACTLLAGATRDLNLMALPGAARMQRLRGDVRCATTGPRLLALYAHAAPARLVAGGEETPVPAGHLAWRLADAAMVVDIHCEDALWMEANP